MTAKSVGTTAAVSLLLSACASVLTPYTSANYEQKLDCRSTSSCQVKVTVACLPICSVSVDKAAVIIKVSDKKDAITWDLDDSIFRFADDKQGIVFDAEGQRVFKCTTESGAHRVRCSSTATNFGVYKYSVRVANPFLIATPLDPWVINN